MLILHQTGAVKVGEIVRYTLTYTSSLDRILPPPSHLHVKIKNTSAIPLRAAYLHGPYTLYVSCYPSTFDPNVKSETYQEEGIPEYEPQLKAGGHWISKLTVPEEVRQDAERTDISLNEEHQRKSFTWIIEVASQVLFSTTAAVHFEVLVGRDEKSVDLGFHGVVGSGHGAPGKLEDHQQGRSRNAAQPRGVFSKAVNLSVDDTESLWNRPPFPEWDEHGNSSLQQGPLQGDKRGADIKPDKKSRKQQKVHLVLLTHGLHSNLGADMLYMKESIDTAAKQAKEDARQRRADVRAHRVAEASDFGRDVTDQRSRSVPELAITPTESIMGEDEEEEEEVLVRGFSGNAVKTERGIQYLGKRLAKYVLSITYPDQPYLPVKSSISKSITRTLTGQKSSDPEGKKPTHKGSSIVKDEKHTNHNLPYKITSISFISHSLGGLIQTYAIAYIQKHSPDFFQLIKPVNFVAMATPFLGLSNENPLYVKFALDFGLVGRTGQDLGLTWRPPTIAKSGWGAMIGGLGNDAQKAQNEPDPGSKPLLRILPTGPAHKALKMFRNRTVYSNVVNDGIVPLRTSCLLFLDWRGLERVEKARRENGLVGTMVGWGWAEMMGQNASAPRKHWNDLFGDSGDEVSTTGKTSPDPGSKVPEADASRGFDYDRETDSDNHQFLDSKSFLGELYKREKATESSDHQPPTLWTGLMSFFKPQAAAKAHNHPPKHQKIYRRGQTMKQYMSHEDNGNARTASLESETDSNRRGLVRGSSLYTNASDDGGLQAPPRTTFFESAGDLLNPPLPPKDFILDPAARPRTIFHDRVYHPDDIPTPPAKRQRTFMRRNSRDGLVPNQANSDMRPISSESLADPANSGAMKIEEKIARAYHKDLSWRKVLVRLEPDAHNNMIVRRMFANAYGWPVVKHMCDTHFAFTIAAQTRDEDEAAEERAKPANVAVGSEGEQVEGQVEPPKEIDEEKKDESNRPKSMDDFDSTNANVDEVHEGLRKLHSKPQRLEKRSESEARESRDELSDLVSRVSVTGQSSNSCSSKNSGKTALSRLARQDSARWTDRFFEDSDNDDDGDEYLTELRKAQERGEYLSERDLTRLSQSSKLSKRSGRSTKSNTSTSSQPGKVLSGSSSLLVAEPADMESASQPASQEFNTPEIKVDDQMLGLTGVGLQKSVEENVVPESSKRERGALA